MVGFIGSGNMAAALARGWNEPALFTDHGSGRGQRLAQELGGEAVSNRECAERAELLILAHKPAHLAEVAGEIADVARATVVSILGGVSLAAVEDVYPHATVFRVEP